MFPETCRSVTEDDRHILTSFRSQLLLVHARITYPDPLPEPIYIDGRLDYELTYREYEGEEIFDVRQRTHRLNLHFHKLLKDNVWEESASYSLKSPDPLSIVDPMYALDHHYSEEHYYHRSDENRARNPMYWDVSAASSDDHLLVALFRRDKYDDTEYHSQMEYGYGPFTNVKIAIFDPPRYNSYYEPCITKGVEFYCDFEDCKITKPFIFVHDDDVFVKVWSKAEALHKFKNLKRASLKSLLNDNGSKWNDSLSIPDSAYSNLTLLGNQIIIVMSHSNNYDPSLYLCALTSCNSNDTWVELTQFDYQFDPAPVAIGSPDGSKLVAIGMMKPQLGSSQDLHVLQVVPQVAAYRPDNKLTLAGVNKVQVGAGISVLSTLEVSLSKLQELAGFNLSGSHNPFYSTNSMIPKYIGKWVNGNNSLLRPTWSNLLTILNKDMKEVAITEDIEKYLTESTADIVENDEKPTKLSARGTEEVADLKHKLDSLYQELKGDKPDSIEAQSNKIMVSSDSIREKLKLCMDQSQVALSKIKTERQDLLDCIEKLQQEKMELSEELIALKQDFQGPPAKYPCIEPVVRNDISTGKSSLTAPPITMNNEHSGLNTCTPPELKHLLEELYMKAANKWEEIGILLGMDPRALDTLKDTHRGVCQKCLMEMLKGWLRSIQPPPTWSAIVKALNILGDEELAEYLEKKYLSADSSCRFY